MKKQYVQLELFPKKKQPKKPNWDLIILLLLLIYVLYCIFTSNAPDV